jgi:hypothetical protein
MASTSRGGLLRDVARYAFADTAETLIQYYMRELAPPGQASELIAAGHVH